MLISISTHKGGAGKTTIATNLAYAIAQLHKDKTVCIVDLDGQCGVNIIFGKSPKKYIGNSILSIITKEAQLQDVIHNDLLDGQKNQIENLFAIYSEPNIRGFDHIINNNIQTKDNLVKTLNYLRNKFDYVIVDTPPSFSTINILTFMSSDLIVSPFEPERQNIEGSFAVINELKKDEYITKPLIHLIPIKVKERTLIDRMMLEYVNDIISLEQKTNNKITLSNFNIPNSTQYKSTSFREKVPLIASKSISKAVILQKELITAIANDVIALLGNIGNK